MNTYPRGWFCLGAANQLQSSRLTPVPAFGTKLVGFRSEGGTPHLLDGYCPHMGAELAHGCLEKNNIRCPFHHWVWGPDGSCREIPYAKRIPERAHLNSWPIRDMHGLLMFWYDPQGYTNPTFNIPELADYKPDEWTEWSLRSVQIHTHWKELVDNVADKAHFGPVHQAPITHFENSFSGHTAVQHSKVASDSLGEMNFVATYYGPAYQIGEYTSLWSGREIRARMLNTHLPLTENSFLLTFGVMLKKASLRPEDDWSEFLEDYTERSMQSFMQDVEIWKHKRYVANPVLCDGDGPLHQLRKWYSQFYEKLPQ